MWYVIQTATGKEEELITGIKMLVNEKLFTDCFIIKAEWMKRLGGEWKIQIRPLFPGYIFIDTEQPEEVFLDLKRIPKFSKILENGKFEFTPVNEEETSFLKLISTSRNLKMKENCYAVQRIVKLTEIATDVHGAIGSLDGILEYFKKDIVRINLHKRFAVVAVTMFHKERTLIFGIKLKQDNYQRENICIGNL